MSSNTNFFKPLFVKGNFNRAGKRSHFAFVKELPTVSGSVRLWRHVGNPENEYPAADTDLYYLFVEAGEYLAPIGLTEYTLEKQTGQHSLTMEHFGGDVGAFWSAWTSCKTPEERDAFNAKYNPLEQEYGQAPARQGAYVSAILNTRKQAWQDAKEDPQKFPDCIGAAVCGEINEWLKVSAAYKARKEAEERAEAEARAAREEAERKEQEARERAEMDAYMELLRKPGRVKDGAKAVKAADALGVKIPLRTRGFMLEKLAAFTVEADGHVESISYYRNGGRAYNGSGVYQTLTELCKAAREYAQGCECGQVSC